jgi:hypothetical protein
MSTELTPEELAIKDAELVRMNEVAAKYEKAALMLANNARAEGVIITISNKQNSFTMGHHRSVVETSFVRKNSEYPNSHVKPKK